MRTLLVLVLVSGLAPDLAEVGEAVVHWVETGHLAHSDADRGDLGHQGPEHGCGTTHHRCTCCASQAAAPVRSLALVRAGDPSPRPIPAVAAPVPARGPERPFRPPIA